MSMGVLIPTICPFACFVERKGGKEREGQGGREGQEEEGDRREVEIPPACGTVYSRTGKPNYGTARDFSRINSFKCPQVKSQEMLSDGDSE